MAVRRTRNMEAAASKRARVEEDDRIEESLEALIVRMENVEWHHLARFNIRMLWYEGMIRVRDQLNEMTALLRYDEDELAKQTPRMRPELPELTDKSADESTHESHDWLPED